MVLSGIFKNLICMKFFIISFFTFLVLFFSSCKKIKTDKLEATWQLTKISDVDLTTDFELWHFQEGKLTRMVRQDITMPVDTTDSCNYVLLVNPFRTKMKISRCGFSLYNGEWKVMKLTSTTLVMLSERDDKFIYREFSKYE